MKTKKALFLMFLILLAALIPAEQSFAVSKNRPGDSSLWGKYISEEIEITLSAKPGISIVLEHSFGDIDVHKGQNERIYIKGEKKVSSRDSGLAKEFLEAMELRIDERGNRVIIRTYYPEDEFSRWERKKIKNFSISYSIEIPENTTLDIENSFGNIDMESISGEFSVTNSFGKVTAYDLDGKTEINNKFGSITAENIGGEARIANEHGSLDIKNVKGSLSAKTSFSSIKVYDVGGDAKITNSHGRINAENIGGGATFVTSFATIECGEIKGETVIRNSHGKVNVNTVQENTNVTTNFGKVTAENIRGNVTVENQHSSVEVTNVLGDAEVHTTFGPVNINRVTGGVIVINQHSSITAKDILPPGINKERRVRLKTSFGTIRLSLPETLSAKVKASASHGKFKCDFPLLVNLQNVVLSGSTTQKIEGAIGDGKDTIELEGSHGSIYLEKSDRGNWDFNEFSNRLQVIPGQGLKIF